MPLLSQVLPSIPTSQALQRNALKVYCNGWQVYPLSQSRYSIGRSNQCSICIKHDKISRLHAILEQTDQGKIKLIDGDGTNRSRNGIFVNGIRIRDCWLKPGDIIHFGDNEVTARLESEVPEKDLPQPIQVQVTPEQNKPKQNDFKIPDLEADLEDESATSFAIEKKSPSNSESVGSSNNLSVESLTTTINQLYYEISVLEQQLKERNQSYELLRKECDELRHSRKESAMLKQQLEDASKNYGLLRTLFDQHRQSTQAKLESAAGMIQKAKQLQARLSVESNENQLFSKQSVVEIVKREKQKMILELLPVIDNFEQAQRQIKPITNTEKTIHNGYQSIHRLCANAFKKMGIIRIQTTHQPFDPTLHEAVACKPTQDFPEDMILIEHQAGFKLGDKVIRPAKVTVASAK